MSIQRPKPGNEDNGIDENLANEGDKEAISFDNLRQAHEAAVIDAERADFLRRWREKYKSPEAS